MKIGLIPDKGFISALVDQCEGCGYGIGDGYVAENVLCKIPASMPVANTSVGVQNLLLHSELMEQLYYNELRFSRQPAVSTLFAFFNGDRFSDFLEVVYSERLMTGEIGPRIGFASGVGIKLKTDPTAALVSLSRIRDVLKQLNYFGEILLEISADYQITFLRFGHFYGHFALFAELSYQSPQELIEFIFGQGHKAELKNMISVANLISQQPFPLIIQNSQGSIVAPRSAENHLWRMRVMNMVEIVLHTTQGSFLGEAKKRWYRTINNMSRHNDELQYRNDFGFLPKGKGFVFEEKTFEDLKQRPLVSQGSSQSPSLPPEHVESTPAQKQDSVQD